MINRENLPLAVKSKDAAFLLGISVRRLWQLTKDGEIPSLRLGDGKRPHVLYRTEDLLAWLENGTNSVYIGDTQTSNRKPTSNEKGEEK